MRSPARDESKQPPAGANTLQHTARNSTRKEFDMAPKVGDWVTTYWQKFECYQPKLVDSIFNARIAVPKDRSAQDIGALFDRARLVKASEIDAMLTSVGFDTKTLPCWTVQFVADNHRCVEGYMVFRFSRILER